jgi:hypothetical protein
MDEHPDFPDDGSGIVSSSATDTQPSAPFEAGPPAVTAPNGKRLHLKTIHRGDPPPCLKQIVHCRGCNGWKPMLKAAREIPLWQKYPFGCICTGLMVRYEEDEDR